MVTLKWPSISERRSPTEQVANCVDLDRTGRLANGLTELTIRNPSKLDGTKSGYISGTEMATLKVAVDLRATQPDRTGSQVC